jgi:class 3 adenylate cyclase
VTFEAGDVHGTTVVEAARLVARAGGGQILATGLLEPWWGRVPRPASSISDPLELKGC